MCLSAVLQQKYTSLDVAFYHYIPVLFAYMGTHRHGQGGGGTCPHLVML